MVLRAIALPSYSFKPAESKLRKTSNQQSEQNLVRLTCNEAMLRSRTGTLLPWKWWRLEKRWGKCIAWGERRKRRCHQQSLVVSTVCKQRTDCDVCYIYPVQAGLSHLCQDEELTVNFITHTQCRLGSTTFVASMLKVWHPTFFKDLCARQCFKQLTWVSDLIPK